MDSAPAWFLACVLVASVILAVVLQRQLNRRKLETRESERRAQAAERLAELGSMTSGLAHEIKNPLSTVVLNAQLVQEELADAGLDEEQANRLLRRTKALEREAVRLREILEDFLQFAGRMKLDPSEHDVRAIVDQLVDFFHPQCDQAGVLLRADLPEQPIMAKVDESLLKQALLNLMINAVQAMESAPSEQPGEMMVRLESDEDEIRIHVIDHGPGIEASRSDEVFHPYVSSKPGGTGLGLPTTRRIVEVHGGRIQLHSKPGAGSDFTIHLPKSPPESDP
jgi:signal transduction histidine kinase